MRCRAIQEHGRRDPIRLRCARSGIRVIYRESRETYSSPSIWDALVKQGHRIGEHRLARLMCQDGIRAKTVKMWRAPNQSSIGSSWPRTLSIARSGSSPKSGVGRRPHLRLTYLAVVLDLYSRRVIGWAMGHHLTVDMAERALTIALSHRPPPRTGSCTTRIAAVSIPP